MSLDLSLNNSEINFKADATGGIDAYEFANFALLPANLLLLKDGQQLPLTPKTVETLIALVERSGEIVTKDQLMSRIWHDAVVEESNLAQYLHGLRKALGQMPDGRPYIETLKRRGYRFNGEVRRIGEPPAMDRLKSAKDAPVNESLPDARRKSYKRRIAGRPLFILSALAVLLFLTGFFVLKKRSGFDRADVPQSLGEAIVVPLTSGENVTQATISHDGQYFVYVDYDGRTSRLRLQKVDGSSRSEIMPPLDELIENLSFSPDDQQVYYVVSGPGADDRGLYRVPVKGGVPTELLDTVTSPVSFSPEGTEILFVQTSPEDGMRQQIVAASADGSSKRVLLESEIDRRLSPNATWSPDGMSVVFGSVTRQFPVYCSLMKLDLSDGSVAALTDEKWDSCYRVTFTHDGGGIAFVGTKQNDAFSTRRDQVYFLKLGSRESRRLTGDGNWHDPMSLGMTEANEIIALPLNRVSELWTVDANGNLASAEQITQGQSDGRGGIVPTRDGKVSFLARDGDGFAIFETDADGQNRRRVIGAPTMQELRSDPEGSFFVFSQQDGDLSQLFRTDRSGGEHRQLTFGNSSKIDSTVSPDGKWIAYADTLFDGNNVILSLQRIPAEGGTPEVLSHEYCGVPHYSHDGKFISCSAPDKIRILSAETGELVREMTTASPFVSNTGARWSPDDKELVYRVVKNGATNLWHQPVAGGPPQQLTRFAKGDLNNFAYSFDGKKLYISRGTVIRNAVLIKNFR